MPGKETVIAALMSVESGPGSPRLETTRQDSGKTITISALFEGGNKADIFLNLGTDAGSKSRPLIEINYHPKDGDMEELIIHYK